MALIARNSRISMQFLYLLSTFVVPCHTQDKSNRLFNPYHIWFGVRHFPPSPRRFSLSLFGCAIFVFIFRIYAYLFRHTPNLRYCRRFIPFLCYYCYFNSCYMEIYFGLVLGNKFLCMCRQIELANLFSAQ